jgi:hypothetical protein
VGGSLVISGQLWATVDGLTLPGVAVTGVLSTPGGPDVAWSAVTDINGAYSATVTPATAGDATVSAATTGTARYAGSSAAGGPITVAPAPLPATLTANLSSSTAAPGDTLAVTGALTGAGTPLAAQQVTVTYPAGAGSATTTATTAGDGTYTASFPATTTGTVIATATPDPATGYLTATSTPAALTVARLASTLTVSGPAKSVARATLAISGTLLGSVGGLGVSGAPVTGVLATPGAVDVTWSATTNSSGAFSTTLTPTTAGTATVRASTTGNTRYSGASATSAPITVSQPPAGFTGKTPTRVLDTRIGLGAPKAPLGAGHTLTLTVPGLPAGTTAVAMNVTTTGPTAASYLTVYPGGAPRPANPTAYFGTATTLAHLVLVPVGPGNTVTFYSNAGTVSVIADVVGYDAFGSGARFTAKAPTRVLDTRIGLGAPKVALSAGRTLILTIHGLPAGTTAVALNVTVTAPTAASYMTVYPGGARRPLASNLNFVLGQTIPNMVLVPVGPDSTVTFYNNAGAVSVVADLTGSYGPAAGAWFTASTSTTVLDTATGIGAPKAKLGAGRALTLTVPSLPAGTTAAAVIVTVSSPTAAGFLTVYPGGAARPLASNLNFVAGVNATNLVMVPVGPGGIVTFFNATGTVDVIADILGTDK